MKKIIPSLFLLIFLYLFFPKSALAFSGSYSLYAANGEENFSIVTQLDSNDVNALSYLKTLYQCSFYDWEVDFYDLSGKKIDEYYTPNPHLIDTTQNTDYISTPFTSNGHYDLKLYAEATSICGTPPTVYQTIYDTNLIDPGASGNFTGSVPITTHSLTGTVYVDVNKNGVQDTNEQGYQGATITLNTGQTATTDNNGNYSFGQIEAGSYVATLTVPTGYFTTTTNPVNVALTANTTQNFGIVQNNQPPQLGTVTINPNPVILGSTITTSNASFTYMGVNDTFTAYWDWGDGSASQSAALMASNGSGVVYGTSHTYTTLGSYPVTLTVYDDTNGLSGSSSAIISVIPAGGLSNGNLKGTNYSGADLSGQNISNSNLTNATLNNTNLSNTNLSNTNLMGASLIDANLTGANLTGANLTSANLTGANLTDANLTNAILKNANLTNVNFTGANLTGVNAKGAILTEIIWSNTICPDGTNSDNDGNTCVGHGF